MPNIEALALVVSEKKTFTCISHYKTVWIPGARLAEFIKRTTIHCYTQNMEVLGHVVSKKIFYVCSNVSLWEPMTPGEGPFLTLGACLAGFMLHTKYRSFGCCGFGEEEFFMCFPL